MALGTRSSAQPSQSSGFLPPPSHNPLAKDDGYDNSDNDKSHDAAHSFEVQGDDKGQDHTAKPDPGSQLTGELTLTKARSKQRKQSKIHELEAKAAALERELASKSIAQQLSQDSQYTDREQTCFPPRNQWERNTAPSAAENEAAALRYLQFLERTATRLRELGLRDINYKLPILTGRANYHTWAEHIRLIMKRYLLEQFIDGQAGSLPPQHPEYAIHEWFKQDAQSTITEALCKRIKRTIMIKAHPEPGRIWRELRYMYGFDNFFPMQ